MTTEARAQIERRLNEVGLRLTPQRFAVLDFLIRTAGHPSAEEIGVGVNRRFPRASRATIYNTLHSLSRSGLVREVYFHDGIARYDVNIDAHHHFVCRVCGELEDVPEGAVTAFPGRALSGHTIENYQVVLRGICIRCSNQRR